VSFSEVDVLHDAVRFEPCHEFAPAEEPWAAACTDCGWLEEDHWPADLERVKVGAALA
jgi:hypothetical protein